MHPDIGGPSRPEIFGTYFFRKPSKDELNRWRDGILYGKIEGRIILNNSGVNLGWQQKEKIIEATGKSIFYFSISKYEPFFFGQEEIDDAFAKIEKLIALSHAHHFTLTFFVTPFYSQLYLNNAKVLLIIKERLAGLTDYHDFSVLIPSPTTP